MARFIADVMHIVSGGVSLFGPQNEPKFSPRLESASSWFAVRRVGDRRCASDERSSRYSGFPLASLVEASRPAVGLPIPLTVDHDGCVAAPTVIVAAARGDGTLTLK